MLKEAKEEIVASSLAMGEVPEHHRIVNVVALFKKGSTDMDRLETTHW